ncbi:MAG TPA: hypothetical protein VNT81_04295 [Vicinamibacterales bacterium]|nr:hypothetical protein [Vicinamibacterales bacterium]
MKLLVAIFALGIGLEKLPRPPLLDLTAPLELAPARGRVKVRANYLVQSGSTIRGTLHALERMGSARWDIRVAGASDLLVLADDDAMSLEAEGVTEKAAMLALTETQAFASRNQPGALYPPAREEFYRSVLPELLERILRRATPVPEAFLNGAASLPHIAFSAYTGLMARQGASGMSAAMALSGAARSIERNNGNSLIAEIVRAHDDGQAKVALTGEQRGVLVQRLRDALLDSTLSVRKTAIEAVMRARDVGAVPILIQLSTTDPDDGAGLPPTYRSVRRLAAQALQQLAP